MALPLFLLAVFRVAKNMAFDLVVFFFMSLLSHQSEKFRKFVTVDR